MMKGMLLMVGLLLQWSVLAQAADTCSVGHEMPNDSFATELAADAGSCQSDNLFASAESRYWHCSAKDSCGKPKNGAVGCDKCYDHAVDLALARCEAQTNDKGTCKIVECYKE